MELLDLIKEFKKIEPDAEYTRRSRMLILETAKSHPKPMVWDLILSSLRFSTATAITAVVIVLIVVGFSLGRFSPVHPLAGLDPVSLKAEAQAIDIQIKLAELGYETANIINQTTTLETALSSIPVAKKDGGEGQEESGVKPGDSLDILETAPSPIDQALEELSL